MNQSEGIECNRTTLQRTKQSRSRPRQRQRQRSRQRVSFNTMAEVNFVEEMLPKQLWWNECDYKHNKRKNKALVQQLTHYERKTKLLHYQRAPGIIARDNVTDNGSNSSNTNIECYRGLECMIDGGRRRSSIHRAAHAAVQLEQARQQLDGPTTASNNNIVKHNERQQQQPKIKTNDDIIRPPPLVVL